MYRKILRKLCLLLVFILGFTNLAGCALYTSYKVENASITREQATAKKNVSNTDQKETDETELDEDGEYYEKDEVALYIYTYEKLPENYITKKEARALGWEGGPVEPYAPGKVIGGDKFGNYEGNLPEEKGRTYTECDIDTKGKARGAKRIVFSNDGLIYYTDDHYETFTLLYGEE